MPFSIPYVAGIVDGEGSIGFGKTRGTIFPRVFVTNTNLDLLNALKDQFGGDINPLSLRKENWAQGYTWRLSWTKAVEFIRRIEPYLFIKDKQAHTILAWDHIRPGRGQKWDKDALALLQERITWLNAKGIKYGNDPIEAVLAELHAPRAA